VQIGSHVRSGNPLQGALDDEADLVQFFLGSRKMLQDTCDGAAELRGLFSFVPGSESYL
jgi:hypothetical protein